MDKPITLLIEEFKQNISNLIAESQLPAFILEYLLKDLYAEVSQISKQMTQKEIAEYRDSQNSKEQAE